MAISLDVRNSVAESFLPVDNSISIQIPYASPCPSVAPTPRRGSEAPATLALDHESSTGDKSEVLPASHFPSGTPVRAIVPLPRRCFNTSRSAGQGKSNMPPVNALRSSVPDRPESDSMDSIIFEAEHDAEDASERRQIDIFQSITAMKARSYVSFEELRVECYAQSFIARGARPEPVPHGAPSRMIIPPFFSPCTVPR